MNSVVFPHSQYKRADEIIKNFMNHVLNMREKFIIACHIIFFFYLLQKHFLSLLMFINFCTSAFFACVLTYKHSRFNKVWGLLKYMTHSTFISISCVCHYFVGLTWDNTWRWMLKTHKNHIIPWVTWNFLCVLLMDLYLSL